MAACSDGKPVSPQFLKMLHHRARPSRACCGRVRSPSSGRRPSPGALGASLLADLERFAFDGDVHLVSASRSRDQRDGACVKAGGGACRTGVDRAALAIPQAGRPRRGHRSARRRGVGGVTSPHACGTRRGRPRGAGALQAADRAHRPLITARRSSGPNCLGHINYVDGTPSTFRSAVRRSAAGGAAQRRHRVAERRDGDRRPGGAAPARASRSRVRSSTGNEALNGSEDFLDSPDRRCKSTDVGCR